MAASILKQKFAKRIFHSFDLHTLAHTMPKQYGATSHPCPMRSAISFSSWLSMLTLLCIVGSVLSYPSCTYVCQIASCTEAWQTLQYNSFLGCCAVCWRLGNHGLFFQSDMRILLLNDYSLWAADRANHWMLQTRIRARRWMMKVCMKIRRWQGWGLANPSAIRCLARPLLLESRTHKGLERAKERWEVGRAIMQEKSSNAWVHVCEQVCFRVKYEAMILMRQPS